MSPPCACGAGDYAIVRRGTYSRLGLDAVPFAVGRCRACGLARTLPPPDDRQYVNGYARSTEEGRFAGAFSDAWSAEVAEWVLGRSHRHRGTVLDIGCHSGNLVAELVARGVAAEGIDIDPLATAEGRARGRPLHTGELAQLDGPYDTIVLNHVIEHVGDLRGLLDEVHRLLVPGGRAHVFTPSHAGLVPRLMGDSWIGWSPLEHVWHFTGRTLRATVHRLSPLRVGSLTAKKVHEPPSHGLRGAVKSAVAAGSSAANWGDELQATLVRVA